MASFSRILSPFSLFLLILAISTQTHLSFSSIDKPLNPTDIHELLLRYGFPAGLLPNNVKSYTLSDDGAFEIELKADCYVMFSELVYYEKKITGKLSYGSVTDVSGIQVKKLFLWLSVSGFKSNQGSGTIVFFVGSLSETFPAEMFRTIPGCRRKGCLGGRTEAM
ncbi:uncharacterized protein LOC111461358 [Cucurbita moschata]|uniref:Uncharacterized protein LOC111461358 n=1 Tax=Cucurbita moschata TaxID=3662 RepID=A0A6J1H9I3_CUCMO|nr:uncharacterized protein LOC111461358 [Cucurbita moschata]